MNRSVGARLRRWRLAGAAWAFVLIFTIIVPLVGFRRLSDRFAGGYRAPPEPLAARVAAATLGASRFVPGATCLTRACAARALFALRGYSVMIRVGVRRRDEDRMAAHAWLLSGRNVILGNEVEGFDDYRPIADFG